MAASLRSVTSMFRPSGERPVVSWTGIYSSGSDGSEVRRGGRHGSRCAAGAGTGVYGGDDGEGSLGQAAPTRKELWRRRHAMGAHAGLGPTAGREEGRREVSQEMRDKCFRCQEKGHYRVDCTYDIVCFHYDLPDHGSEDCKHPRSPSPINELRRDAVAKVAHRVSPSASLVPQVHRLPPPPRRLPGRLPAMCA